MTVEVAEWHLGVSHNPQGAALKLLPQQAGREAQHLAKPKALKEVPYLSLPGWGAQVCRVLEVAFPGELGLPEPAKGVNVPLCAACAGRRWVSTQDIWPVRWLQRRVLLCTTCRIARNL